MTVHKHGVYPLTRAATGAASQPREASLLLHGTAASSSALPLDASTAVASNLEAAEALRAAAMPRAGGGQAGGGGGLGGGVVRERRAEGADAGERWHV